MSSDSQTDDKLGQVLEAILGDRLNKEAGYYEVPTDLFVARIDVKMPPLPEVAFYEKKGIQKFEKIRDTHQPYSALALSSFDAIWIKEEDLKILKRFTEAKVLSTGGGSKHLPTEKRMMILRQSAINVVDDLFKDPSPENISRSAKVVGSFVHLLMKDPKSYLFLARLSSHDPYTLQHSVGTAVNCIILARKIGITDETALNDAGLGGLLHDIGKVKVDPKIINKEGPLDEFEWKEMKTHSAAGYEILRDNPDISERTKRAVLEHHEEKAGTGYPHGKKESEIDLYAKIVCVSDIFNALTTNRSYSKAKTPFDAFQLIRDKLTHKVDHELFKQLVMIYGGKIDEMVSDAEKNKAA